ncbi:MAG: hypothetical protein ACFFDD_13865 [Promethearchaeota archaeon]
MGRAKFKDGFLSDKSLSLFGTNFRSRKPTEVFRIESHPMQEQDSQYSCLWCGQTFTPSVWTPLSPLSYCSYRCAFAGEFYTLTCCAILITGASIYAATQMLELFLGAPYGGFILLLLWGVAVLFWFEAYFGYRIRKARKNGIENQV